MTRPTPRKASAEVRDRAVLKMLDHGSDLAAKLEALQRENRDITRPMRSLRRAASEEPQPGRSAEQI